VAKASLEELLIDYEDYLRVRSLPQWTPSHHRYAQMLEYAKSDRITQEIHDLKDRLNDEELANLCITLINQATYLLKRLIIRQEEQFLKEGGIREQMTRARLKYRRGDDVDKSNLS
jgi:four helix bundle suffix protein